MPANLLFLLIVSTLISTMLLRAAVVIYNRITAQPSVGGLSFRQALGISLVTFLIGAVAGAVVGGVLQVEGRPPQDVLPLMYASIGLNVVVTASLVGYVLQIPFRRGLTIAALQTFIQFLIVAACLMLYALTGGSIAP
ncbi:MAG: hypothetical protein QM775_00395 [Pirellulales bacterium]